jgi:hypothetical protein
MSDIAIRVDHLSKLYHLGRAQQRHDTLRDALVAALPRILRLGFANGLQASPCGTGQVSRKGKDNSSNSSNSWQQEGGNSSSSALGSSTLNTSANSRVNAYM